MRFAQHHGIVVELRSARNHDARLGCLPVRSTPAGEATHSLPARSCRKSNATRRFSGSFHHRIHEMTVVHAAWSAARGDQQVAVPVLANGENLVARQAVLLGIDPRRFPSTNCTRPLP